MQVGTCFRVRDEDIGLMHYFLGMEVSQQDGHVFQGQGKYASDILRTFQMEGCRPMLTPTTTNFRKLVASESKLVDLTLYRQLIGSLMYLVNTKPDISFFMNTLNQFMVEPQRVHWTAAKHTMRYIVGVQGLQPLPVGAGKVIVYNGVFVLLPVVDW